MKQFISSSIVFLAVCLHMMNGHAQEVPELHFSELFMMPIGPKGLEFNPRLLSVIGQRVRIKGFMVQHENGPAEGQFLLASRPVKMSEHADGEADDLPAATILVRLSPDQSTWRLPHIAGLIQLEGILSAGRQEDRNGRISWLSLDMEREATRLMTPFELSRYLLSRLHTHQ